MPNLSNFSTKEEYNKWFRDYRKASPEYKNYHRVYNKLWRIENSTNKDKVRDKFHRAFKKGLIVKTPCEVCGEEKVEAHHDDYRSPLKVNWLCRIHHRERDVLKGKRKY